MKKSFFAVALAIAAVVFTSACVEGENLNLGTATHSLISGDSCGENVAPLVMYNSNQVVGNVSATNTDTELNITFQMDPTIGYKLLDVFVFAGTGDIPRYEGGSYPDYQQFNIKQSFYPAGTPSLNVALNLADVVTGDFVGQTINMAVYVVVIDAAGNVNHGWAFGDQGVGCGCYGVKYPYTFCGQPDTAEGCTLTQGYWKNHNEFAKNKKQKRNWPLPMDEKGKICSSEYRTNLQILTTPPSGGNAYLILAHQLLAAQLNIASGASSTVQVDAALANGQALINQYCGQFVHASSTDGQQMTIFAGVLDAYNNGITGPGHCGGLETPKY